MAELVGLVASVVGLASATAAVSSTLIECARTLIHAKTELEDLAMDVQDLGTVLEYLGEVLERAERQVSEKAIQVLTSLSKRCGKALDELKVTAQLVKSRAGLINWLFRKPKILEHKLNLEGFKSTLGLMLKTLDFAASVGSESLKTSEKSKRNVSAATQLNLDRMRSAVLTNNGVLERLKDAEKERSKTADVALTPDEKKAKDALEAEYSSGPAWTGDHSIMQANEFLTWEKVLLRSYKDLSTQPPVVRALVAALPSTGDTGQDESKSSASCRKATGNDTKTGIKAATDEEIKILVRDWTTVPESDIKRHLEQERVNEEYGNREFRYVPRWVQDEQVYTFIGYDPDNPNHWKRKTAPSNDYGKILPHSRFAFESGDAEEVALFDIFVEEGGAWVWRHDNGAQRDYFIKDKKVVQYFIKPPSNSGSNQQIELPDRTIVGKQWVSKDIMEKAKLNFDTYGEGSWAIEGKLSPVSTFALANFVLTDEKSMQAQVTDLHRSASKRTEELLHRLGSRYAKPNPSPRAAKQKAVALFAFNSEQSGDLAFQKGDILTVLGSTENTNTWWTATLNGESGLVPANYLRIVNSDEPSQADSAQPNYASGEQAKATVEDEGAGANAKESSTSRTYDRWKAKFDTWRWGVKKDQTSG